LEHRLRHDESRREKADYILQNTVRKKLVARPEVFARTVTERLLMYAVNRQLEYFDMPQVRAVVRGAAKDNYRFSSIVRGIVNTDAFRKQGAAK